MYCKNCGKELSNDASFCDGCGKSTSGNDIRSKKIAGVFLGIIAFICAFLGVIIFVSNKPTSDNIQNTQYTNSTSSTTATQNNEHWLLSGMYKVGTDIPAGEYFVCNTNPTLCYIEISADSSGQFGSIITNDNITTFAFISVEEGQYLTVRGGKFTSSINAQTPSADSDGFFVEGMYRIGIDIPAGEYKVFATTDYLCYLEVCSDSSGLFTSIITNENFETSTYITVADGQYLTIVGGKFTHAN